MIRLLTLPAGFILDLLMGDPRWLYHPVCLIGNLISILEKGIRKVFPKTDKGERAGGILEVVLVCFITFFIPYVVIHLLYKWNFWLGFALETFWCGQLLATKSLKAESMKVYDRLKNGTIEEARYAVSMIVGRDTKELTEEGVTKAAVETVAENASDGIIAPMFYMAIGGIPLMFLYKGINTMDSMLGYKNDKYLHFGRCAARLDDVANYIPARISAHSINFVFHGIQHGNYLLRCIFFWQIISWSVIKQIAQQNQALCPFFLKSIQHFPAIVSRTMDVRSKHIFHKLGFSSVFSVRIVSLLFGLHNLMKRTFFFFTLSCLDGNYKIVLF